MSRISNAFQNKTTYVAYLTAGDGGLERSYQAMMALIQGGVDILEVGVPFSDPVADGPVIQAAAQRALQQGVTLDDVIQLVARVRQQSDVPIILFSYYNPIFIAMQNGDFFQRAKQAGVDGLLIVDVPFEESDEYYNEVIAAGIDPIFLISPSTPLERIRMINERARGMLYYVCRKGTTGMRAELPDDIQQRLSDIKSVSQIPVVAGFGIADSQMAKAVSEHCDGFVVGSRFVKAVADGVSPEQLTELARDIDPRVTVS